MSRVIFHRYPVEADMQVRDVIRDRTNQFASQAPHPQTLSRWGLGFMLLAAGGHKLLDPSTWAVYVTNWVAPWLVVSPTEFMLANGYLELGFGAALLADRYTAFAAFVAAVSLTLTTGYLMIVWVTAGVFGDVVARDIGLTGLAWTVLIGSLQSGGWNS